MVIYSACVSGLPCSLSVPKLWGIPLGCAAIFGFNVHPNRDAPHRRTPSGMNYFDFFHVYFWQATLIAMIVGVLYGWIRTLRAPMKKARAHRSLHSPVISIGLTWIWHEWARESYARPGSRRRCAANLRPVRIRRRAGRCSTASAISTSYPSSAWSS